jgi:hypothetical protein
MREEPGPKFVLAHVLLPHEPYVFLADGSYPDARQRARPEAVRFAEQLSYLNRRIRTIVDTLLDVPAERRPIIIIQADEGPQPPRYHAAPKTFDWQTATDAELVAKFGILSAFYLPAGAPEPEVWPDLTPVNTFRLVFDRVFGAGLPLLPERIYTSENLEHPYAFTEITERLAAIDAAHVGRVPAVEGDTPVHE